MEVSIDIRKLHKKLCPKCKKKLEEMAKESISNQQIKQFFKEEEKERE